MAKQKRRRSHLQISLRMLLVLVTMAAIALGYDQRFRRQHQAARQLADADAKITYHPPLFGFLPAWLGDRLRDVEAVDLSHCLVDSDRLKLLVRLPRLERLYLARTAVSNEDLPILARLTKLKRLALWHTQMNGGGIHHLAALQNLRVLDVHGIRLSEDALETFAKLPNLRQLKIDIQTYSDRGLALLASMHAMPIGDLHCQDLTDAGLASLRALDRKHYRITQLTNCVITDEAFLALAPNGVPLPVGPVFQVRNCGISDRALAALPWDELTDVRFIETNVTYDAAVEIFGEQMTVLNVGTNGFSIAEAFDESLNNSWATKGLTVWFAQDPSQLTAAQLGKLPNLTRVHVNRKLSAGDLLVHLRDHAHIKQFDMSSVPAETPVIEQIADWRQLEHAIISCCNPRTSFDIRPLAKLKKLRKLQFSCTPFGDEAFEVFGQLEQLNELKMTSANKVTGTGLQHLRKLTQLKNLEIQSTQNWDASFADLMALQNVKRISLIDVKLSPTNLETFNSHKGRGHVTWR